MCTSLFLHLILVLLGLVSAKGPQFGLQLFSNETVTEFSAHCLDGSPAGYYVRTLESHTETNKWVIYFEGGGYCDVKHPHPNGQPCSERIHSSLGSSKYWPGGHNGIGLQLYERKINPNFWNWRHVYVRYCTGDVYTGNHTGPTEEGFYFTGARHVEALIHVLATEHQFGNAEDVIITGDSAGGMATILHVDRFADAAPKARVVGNPLAGFFLFQPTYTGNSTKENLWRETFSRLTGVWKSIYSQRCMAGTTPEDGYLCITGPHGSKFIRSHMFFGQNAYDTAQLFSQEGGTPRSAMHPASANEWVENFGREMAGYLNNTNPSWGFWLASCFNHSSALEHHFWDPKYNIAGHPVGHGFQHWWLGHQVRLIETPFWPVSNSYDTCRKWP